jgi:hypothetical protein
MPESMTAHIEMGIKPGIFKNLFQVILHSSYGEAVAFFGDE